MYKRQVVGRALGGVGSHAVGEVQKAPQVRELLLGAQLVHVFKGRAAVCSAADPQLKVVHGVDQLVLIVDQDILPDGVIGLDQVQVHPVETVLLSFQQSVGPVSYTHLDVYKRQG